MAKLVLFSGKGGVGKTTIASAVACDMAEKGYKTLIFSSDPAHSTRDSFLVDIHDTPTYIKERLWAVEIDPLKSMGSLAPKLMDALTVPLESLGIDGLDLSGEDLQIPGLDEILAFDQLLRYLQSPKYDIIIFDTAPTGHTLRFLSLPEIADRWIGKMVRMKVHIKNIKKFLTGKKDTTVEELDYLKSRVEQVRSILSNPKYSSMYLVSIPEMMSVEETKRADKILAGYGIPVKGVVINKRQPENECGFCLSRRSTQTEEVARLKSHFRDREKIVLELQSGDIHGIGHLTILGSTIDLNINPQKSVITKQNGNVWTLKIFCPGADKSKLKLNYREGELEVVISGEIAKFPTPFQTNRKNTSARFEDDWLIVEARWVGE